MKEKNLPKRLREYLDDDEDVESSYKNYYATNKRLIQLGRGGFSEVEYQHITAINYDSALLRPLFAAGIIILIAGITDFLLYKGEVLGICGAIVIALAFTIRIKRYRVRTSGDQNFDVYGQNRDSAAFLRVIREHSAPQKPVVVVQKRYYSGAKDGYQQKFNEQKAKKIMLKYLAVSNEHVMKMDEIAFVKDEGIWRFFVELGGVYKQIDIDNNGDIVKDEEFDTIEEYRKKLQYLG